MKNNMFLKAVTIGVTTTENGSKAYLSTGSHMSDQFGKAGNYRGRDYQMVCNDQSLLWDEDPNMALKFPFYLRMITRKTKVNNDFITEKVQRGQGMRDESFKRLLWIAQNHAESFNTNIWILPIIGSWKDIWTLMFLDNTLGTKCINHEVMFTLIAQGMKLDEHVELIKKFMPRIKSSSKCTTEWTKITNNLAKEFASFMGCKYSEYNKFKSSGKAHEFQKMMCSKQYDKINWNLIPGRALTLLAKGKFLSNHSLTDEYENWLCQKPVANFTGYVYELGKVLRPYLGVQYDYKTNKWNTTCSVPKHIRMTLDKQFEGLVQKAKDGGNGAINGNVWCALDTSGSMSIGTAVGVSALDICTSLGVFFSTLNEGAFNKNVIMFDSTSNVKQLTGNFCDMMSQLPMNAMGSTNVNSVVNEICRIRKTYPDTPLSDYPTTLLVVSDMHFNGNSNQTNYEYLKSKLAQCFPTEWVNQFKVVWWNVACRDTVFPSTMDDGGTYFLSGMDGSVISLLLGGEVKTVDGKQPTMAELMESALNQEILQQIVLVS